MAASGRRARTEMAEEYAALARQAEREGEHGRAADLYRAALFVLYNYRPLGELSLEAIEAVENSDGEAGAPGQFAHR
jgi:hypothetical protein